jgi:molybdopterin molybdotransferase
MGRILLSYKEALQRIWESVDPPLHTEQVDLNRAAGRVLAEDLVAEDANPRFANSAVDGYAIGSRNDAVRGAVLNISRCVSAGEASSVPIPAGSAYRILTGAPVPLGTYAVVMQEDVIVQGDRVEIASEAREGDFIRSRGGDFMPGDRLLSSGTMIHASNIPLFAFCGVSAPTVYRLPRVAVVSTGDELVDMTDVPAGPQIRDTNGPMLAALTASIVGATPTVTRFKDEYSEVVSAIGKLCEEHDVVIVSGGASVGDRDHIARVVAELGSITFHGVRIRPGKPTLMGKVKKAHVFGLPGNPASSFVCFELFVREALLRTMGSTNLAHQWIPMTIGFDHKAMGREDFVRGKLEGEMLVPVGEQGSFGIISSAHSELLVRLDADRDNFAGEKCLATFMR